MGNGPGDLEAYFERLYKYPGYIGGFVWEWCDHSVYSGQKPSKAKINSSTAATERRVHDGNFCMDGLVYPGSYVRTPVFWN